MIILTFDEYDEICDKIEKSKKPKNLKFEPIEEIERRLSANADYLKNAVKMMTFTEDEEYAKAINNLLREMIYLVDDESDKNGAKAYISAKNKKISFTPEELLELIEKVKNMDFQCSYWFPTVLDLKKFDFFPNKEHIAFLLWLVNTEMELTDEEERAREYARSILADKLKKED